MEKLLKNSINRILTTEVYYKDVENLKKVVNILNKDSFIIISGMIGVGKLHFIKFLLDSIGTNSGFFYFNIKLDVNNSISDSQDLDKLFELFKDKFGNPKIIILENIIGVPGIKEFINKIHKLKGYKLILLGNSIKIPGIKEVTIPSKLLNPNISELLNYGRLQNTLLIKDNLLKREVLDLTKDNIILKDIILSFGLKNINLLYQTTTYLAFYNNTLSLRELHKNLNDKNIKVSLITIIDYINNLLSSKMINRSYTFNLKTNKEITSRAKYYFNDNGIRNSFGLYNLNRDLLKENFIYTQLLAKGYSAFNGKNGTFDFTFYGIKNNDLNLNTNLDISTLNNKEDKIFIHFSKQSDKKELKKEVNKLLKIDGEGKRFLVVDDEQINNLSIRKFNYDSIRLVRFEELLEELR